ncbi:MAG: dihydropteroate synthase [Pseudohongiellaceae bacterium]
MGIINVTPDSFSDGSQFQSSTSSRGFSVDISKVLKTVASMIEEGATFIDVGGESTRPGAMTVSEQEELSRVIPVIEAVRSNFDVCISVDTSSPATMKAAIEAGAEVVNDVRALSRVGALEVVAESNAAVCLMHMQGQPSSMQQSVSYSDVLQEVFAFLQSRIRGSLDAGIDCSRIMIDPGFGFGKSLDHNFQLLKHLARFEELELPLLVGISRKSMIGGATDRPVDQRLAGSIAATMPALAGGAKIIRTHDVAATMDAIRVHCALLDA